jgi:hypothetical protein
VVGVGCTYDGSGELNNASKKPKRRSLACITRTKRYFREKFVTKCKKNFQALSKDKNKELTDKQMVDKLLQGIRSTDTSIASVEFLSGLISSIHAAAQLDYANQNSGNKRQYVSAMGSNDQRGGRGRARQ